MTHLIETPVASLNFAIPYKEGWFASRCEITNNGKSYKMNVFEYLYIKPHGEIEIILSEYKNQNISLYKDLKNKLRFVLRVYVNSDTENPLIWESEKAANPSSFKDERYVDDKRVISYSDRTHRTDRFMVFPNIKIPKHSLSEKDKNNEILIIDFFGRSVMMELPIDSYFASMNKEETAIIFIGDKGFIIVDNPFM